MNLLQYPSNSKNLSTSVNASSDSHCRIASTLVGPIGTPPLEITCPKNFTFSNHNSHLDNLHTIVCLSKFEEDIEGVIYVLQMS